MHKAYRFFIHFLLCLIGITCADAISAQNADIDILRSINSNRNASGDKIMAPVSASAEPIAIALPVVELVYGYCRHEPGIVASGWQTVAALGITGIVSTSLKYAVDRQRPYITYPDIHSYTKENTPSFPSGHTSFAFCSATSLGMAFPRWYIVLPAYVWAASVGYSRLYLGEHYPTDVIAGAIVGTGSAWLAARGNKWLHRRKASRNRQVME